MAFPIKIKVARTTLSIAFDRDDQSYKLYVGGNLASITSSLDIARKSMKLHAETLIEREIDDQLVADV